MYHCHKLIYQHLLQRWGAGSLPHALLLSGEAGLGKRLFARTLAKRLLCVGAAQGDYACNQCYSCRFFQAGTHPDFYELGLEDQNEQEAKFIKIDQIRELCQHLVLKSRNGGLKIAIINPAEQMNHNAANSLLKTLEEPSPDTLLILVSITPFKLLPTIRSRCQRVQFPLPSESERLEHIKKKFPELDAAKLLAAGIHTENDDELTAKEWLKTREDFFHYLSGLTSNTLELSEAAAYAVDNAAERILFWFSRCVEDMIKIKITANIQLIGNMDFKEALQGWTKRIDLKRLFSFYTELNQARALILGSVNPQLLLETVLLSWAELYVSS